MIEDFPLCKSTSVHVLFLHIDPISSSMASFHPLWCSVSNTLNGFLTSNVSMVKKVRWYFYNRKRHRNS
jgi:hypothetical protein